MGALRMPVWTLALFFLTFSISQAKTNYAYVANDGVNTVSVINTSNNTVVATIPVGASPWGAAVNQAASVVYVTDQLSNNVAVISTASNTVTAYIPVGTNPAGVAFAPNGKTAYVANAYSSSISVINTATKKVTATIPLQQGWSACLAVTPDGAYVYVANSWTNNVSVISTLTNKVVATISVGNAPTFLAISPDGSTVYVPNNGSNTISVIRVADNTVVNTIAVEGAWGAAVSPDGQWLYSTDYDTGAGNLVTVIDTSTQKISTTIVVGQNPQVTAFSEDSTFAYVANSSSASVSVINTASQTVVDTISVGSGPGGVSLMGTMHVSTVAGGYVGDNGPATSAALTPYFSLLDSAGNLYISDLHLNRVRKADASGTITTYVGNGTCGYNGDSIPATKAMVCYPEGLAQDASGNLILGDGLNSRVRKINHSTGKITTIVGTGASGYSGDGGSALKAQIGQPVFPAYDSSGNLYFSDIAYCVIRKVNTKGTITTAAGTGTCGYNGDSIPATSAQLNQPDGIVFDSAGNLYIADIYNYRVRKVDQSGTITTFAGTGNPGFSGDGGPATKANIDTPRGLTILSGLLYIANAGQSRVRTVDLASGVINTYAGSVTGYDGDNNSLLSTRFDVPHDAIFDPAGNPIFDDLYNGRVRKATNGIVNTIAGGFLGDGLSATSAALVRPEALAIDTSNSLYIAESSGNRIRKVSGGKISTIAGTGVNGYSGDGGPATGALLNFPLGVAVDSSGNVFIADTNNEAIRKVDTTGKISTFVTNSDFCYLNQMARDSANNLYVADECTSVIFKITPAGSVSVVAGVPFTYGYNGDNIPATTAYLNEPIGVAVDRSGNILIADTYNSRLRMVDTSGIIHTLVGDGTCNYTGDGGPATAAETCYPWSVAVTKAGTIYFTDTAYLRVRMISGGIITAFAGSEYFFNGDGLWPLFTGFADPVAVALDSKGAVYVSDDIEHRVRKIQ